MHRRAQEINEGVLQTAESAVDTAQRLLALFEVDERTVRETGRAAAGAQRALAVFKRRPIGTIDGVAKGADMSFPTASRAIGILQDAGIIHELTGKQRNRVFAYTRYLAILNEGTAP